MQETAPCQLNTTVSLLIPQEHEAVESYIQCDYKNKANYVLLLRHQTATQRSNFWHSDLTDNYESAYDYVFHLTCVIPIPGKTFQPGYIWAINKTVIQ